METYFEDCCQNHTTSQDNGQPGQPPFWKGFLAGPQGPHYRHLLVEGARDVGFYHLNCEHGTGEVRRREEGGGTQPLWCTVLWCTMLCCGVVWCTVVVCGVVWCGVLWCGVV